MEEPLIRKADEEDEGKEEQEEDTEETKRIREIQQEEEQRCYLNVRGPREQGAPQQGLLICHRLRDAKSLSVFLGIVFDNAEFFLRNPT